MPIRKSHLDSLDSIESSWFYQEGRGYRSLEEMIGHYHQSVGLGGNLLLNVAPPINSSIPVSAMVEYAALGAFVRSCYGKGSEASKTSLASTQNGCFACSNITLTLRQPSKVDRFLIKEELRQGTFELPTATANPYRATCTCI